VRPPAAVAFRYDHRRVRCKLHRAGSERAAQRGPQLGGSGHAASASL